MTLSIGLPVHEVANKVDVFKMTKRKILSSSQPLEILNDL